MKSDNKGFDATLNQGGLLIQLGDSVAIEYSKMGEATQK